MIISHGVWGGGAWGLPPSGEELVGMLEDFQEEVTWNLTLPCGSVFKSLLEQLGRNRI